MIFLQFLKLATAEAKVAEQNTKRNRRYDGDGVEGRKQQGQQKFMEREKNGEDAPSIQTFQFARRRRKKKKFGRNKKRSRRI